MRFKYKFVLVTGANRNTGLGIAASFAAEGATVFLNGPTVETVKLGLDELRQRGLSGLVGIAGDLRVPADVNAMFAQIGKLTNRLDVLVNNAAHQGVGHTFEDTPLDFFESVLQVNLVGLFHVTQHAVRLMKPHGGAIVNIGSNVSTRAIRNRTAYLASKGGVDALTLALAVELGPYRIRVNNVAPGYINTDRWETLPADIAQRRRANLPLGREATAEDIAQAAMFLASDHAANISGTRLVVDGGCSAQHLPIDAEV